MQPKELRLNIMEKFIASLFTSLLLIAPSTKAQELLLQLGADLGGDELAEVHFDNGDEKDIDAGGLLHVAIGGVSRHEIGHGTMAGSGTFYYQLWFRNTPAMFCTPDAFNLSNGRALSW